jgi:hypothetical protein
MFKLNILAFIVLFVSCKYDDQYTGEPIPIISAVTLNQTAYKQFSDTVVITLKYKDGDGDLGFESADSLSVEVKDMRFEKPDYYHLRPIVSLDKKIAISGEIRIALKNLFLLSSGSQENTQFSIRIKDRAQHWSNRLTTKSIIINK